MRRDFLYIAFCLILPALWGIVSALLFDRCQAWLAQRRDSATGRIYDRPVEEPSPDMYHI
jgi:hypothetical protein